MNPDEVKLWRRAERERLLALRQGLSPEDRRRRSERIEAELRSLLGEIPGTLGVYWPFRAEFGPRPLVDWAVDAGRKVALPVVVDKKGPLEYRAWKPGEPVWTGTVDGKPVAVQVRPIANGFQLSWRGTFAKTQVYTEQEAE